MWDVIFFYWIILFILYRQYKGNAFHRHFYVSQAETFLFSVKYVPPILPMFSISNVIHQQ